MAYDVDDVAQRHPFTDTTRWARAFLVLFDLDRRADPRYREVTNVAQLATDSAGLRGFLSDRTSDAIIGYIQASHPDLYAFFCRQPDGNIDRSFADLDKGF